jgi:hypothetical protein
MFALRPQAPHRAAGCSVGRKSIDCNLHRYEVSTTHGNSNELRTHVRNCTSPLEAPIVDYKVIAIKNGGIRPEQRCTRTDCIFPQPIVRFDIEGSRILATWGWIGIDVDGTPNRVRITVRPNLLIVRTSCN